MDNADNESAALLARFNRARTRDPSPMPMFMPGRVLHLVKTKSRKTWCGLSKERLYEARWADVTEFDHVLISPLMVADHMPDKVMKVLAQVMEQSSHDTRVTIADVAARSTVSDV